MDFILDNHMGVLDVYNLLSNGLAFCENTKTNQANN